MSSKGWNYFLKLCLSAQDEKTLRELFDLLFTQDEKESVKMRCLILKELLEQKKTQRKISEDLKVSIAKITRGSNELKEISSKLKQYLQRIFEG